MEKTKSSLGSVAEIFGGYAFSSSQYTEGEIPLIRISNIKNNGVVELDYSCSIEEDLRLKQFLIKKDDILIALSGATTGKFGKFETDQKAYLNQRVGLIRAKENSCQKFLYFFLNKIKDEVLRKAGGAAQPNISTGQLSDFEIPLPPLPTQQKIAEKLDKADALRKKDQQLLKYYDELAQSVFIEMFGDVQKNDKNFKTSQGSELFKLSSGKFNPTKNLDDSYDFPTYGGNGITGYSKEFLIDYPTIIIGRVGVYCGSIHKSTGKSWITDNAIFIKEFYQHLNLTFLEFVLNHNNLNRFADYSGQPKITQKPIENLKIINPPLPLQQKFASIIQNIELQKQKVKLQAEESENLFQALLQESFA